MSSLASRLWNLSAASLTAAVQHRLRLLRRREAWHTLAAGPAAGVQLLLPTPLESWGREMVDGTFDRFFYEALARVKTLKGARCWDIGSFIGYHAFAFANQGAVVIAFEPGTANRERLRLHLEKNPALAARIRHVAAAVGDRDGETTFIESRDLAGASTGSHLADADVPLRAEVYAAFERVTVPVMRLDTFMGRERVPAPDVLKIDVEGAELQVLQGARALLSKHRPLLLVEVHNICQMFGVQAFLGELGYQREILDPEHAGPSRCFIMAW